MIVTWINYLKDTEEKLFRDNNFFLISLEKLSYICSANYQLKCISDNFFPCYYVVWIFFPNRNINSFLSCLKFILKIGILSLRLGIYLYLFKEEITIDRNFTILSEEMFRLQLNFKWRRFEQLHSLKYLSEDESSTNTCRKSDRVMIKDFSI